MEDDEDEEDDESTPSKPFSASAVVGLKLARRDWECAIGSAQEERAAAAARRMGAREDFTGRRFMFAIYRNVVYDTVNSVLI